MQQQNKEFVKTIIDAIQDKMGKDIVVADFKSIKNVICDYFIICQGNNRNQIEAIARNISEKTLIKTGDKPLTVSGQDNAIWIAIDYGDVMVHIFQSEARRFYDLEHLWADAKLTHIPDIDTGETAV